ncbi:MULTISPECIES: class I SAM-dependent methyltransferase [Methylomonas]|uniref:class I SAM-dependent methyltransferase n=1 Tax=Methylomonas TaxID=416 RepID=UPI001232A166|nr:class I SAM-dependent methyltransferase [Methylomonas rhizoryzae]
MDTTLPDGYSPVCCDYCGHCDGQPRYRLHHSWLVSCPQCGMTYVNPRVKTALLREKLQAWAENDVVDAERIRIAFEENTLSLYRSYLAELQRLHRLPGTRLLDIGCSTGAFLSVARENHWLVEGLEYGNASAEYARTALGLKVHNAAVEEFRPDQAFDVVSLLEVIEHLESPRACLTRIRDWLHPDGLLLISTPNFDSLYRRCFGAQWWVVNCEDEHIQLFNKATLCAMLEATGYQVEHVVIRSIDIAGLIRQTLGSFKSRQPDGDAEMADYYQTRGRKEKIKTLLAKTGLLKLVRTLLRGLDYLFSQPWSPLFGWGEQLIVIARRRT